MLYQHIYTQQGDQNINPSVSVDQAFPAHLSCRLIHLHELGDVLPSFVDAEAVLEMTCCQGRMDG